MPDNCNTLLYRRIIRWSVEEKANHRTYVYQTNVLPEGTQVPKDDDLLEFGQANVLPDGTQVPKDDDLLEFGVLFTQFRNAMKKESKEERAVFHTTKFGKTENVSLYALLAAYLSLKEDTHFNNILNLSMGAAESDDVKRFLHPQSPLDPHELYAVIESLRNRVHKCESVQAVRQKWNAHLEAPNVIVSIRNEKDDDTFRLSYNGRCTDPIIYSSSRFSTDIKPELNKIVPTYINQVKSVDRERWGGTWNSCINGSICFDSCFHSDILTLKATAEDPQSDLTNRLTVTHSIVLNIAPDNEPHKKASLTFLLDRNTKTATLDTCVVNKEASLPSRKGSAAEAGGQEGIAPSQKANGEPKTLNYIPNDDLLQVIESLCSPVAEVNKPDIYLHQVFDGFSGTIVCIPYPISIQSPPYPFFYRQLPELFKLIQRHTGSFTKIRVSRFQCGDPLNDEGKAYLITQMVDSLTNQMCPYIRIKDGSFIVKGDDATLTHQEKDIYEGFGYLIGLLFNDDTQTDIQRKVVDQLFKPGLLSIDILRADPKSFAYHVARLCYAGEPLGRLPDYLLPPSKTSKVSPRGRTQSRSRRSAYAADEDEDDDELFAHLPDEVPRDKPSPAASDYSRIKKLGQQQVAFHRAQQAVWSVSTTQSSIDNRMLSIKDKDLQTCIYNIIADAANRNHRTLSSSLEEAKQQWELRLPRLLIDAFRGLNVLGYIDLDVNKMNVDKKCWNVFTESCYHYLQQSCKLQTPPLKAINQGFKVFTTSHQYDVERFFEKISTLNIGGQYVHEGGTCAGGAQELFSSRSLSPTLHREKAASSSS